MTVPAFRNLQEVAFSPVEGVNVICGENGQGKTNLLEALWLCTGAASFRGAKENELLPLGGETAQVRLSFSAYRREMEIALTYGRKKKRILLNGVEEASPAALAGQLCAVVFSPAHLSLVRGAPEERRRSLDTMIGQCKPRYRKVLSEYRRLLNQRNTLLKDSGQAPALLDTLPVWDASLARIGALVTKTRQSYLEKLAPFAGEIYRGISGAREALSFRYEASAEADGAVTEEGFLRLLTDARPADLRTGSTSVGPQRDDFEFLLDALPAKSYGSQGQQRSAVLALKLAECALLREVTGEEPLVLLDDVMSELDEHRRDYLLHHLTGRQIFLTCCDPHQIAGAEAVFSMAAGRLRKEG